MKARWGKDRAFTVRLPVDYRGAGSGSAEMLRRGVNGDILLFCLLSRSPPATIGLSSNKGVFFDTLGVFEATMLLES